MTRVRIVLLALLPAVIVMNPPRIAAQEKGLLSRLQVGTHVYFPDGGSVARWHRFDSAATKPGSAFQMYTAETLCVFSTDPKRHPAGYGWQITLTPVKELGDTLVFRVDWTRTRCASVRNRAERREDCPGHLRRLRSGPGASVRNPSG
jgi:hypothetical protein